jgi:hypothetical protein
VGPPALALRAMDHVTGERREQAERPVPHLTIIRKQDCPIMGEVQSPGHRSWLGGDHKALVRVEHRTAGPIRPVISHYQEANVSR